MSEPINLSNSGRQKYEHCPTMYKLHYVDKIRPAGTTSSLLFGSAIDKACENYMLDRVPLRARGIFKEEWRKLQEEGHEAIEFHNNDFDAELLVQSDNDLLLEGSSFETVSDLVSVLRDEELIKTEEEIQRLAYANWISLYRKGTLLVNRFIAWVDENVEEVLGCQVPIELEDEEGNKVPGFADFVIKIKGYDKPILVDLKTAARYYDRNSVKESEQLALYFLYLKSTKFPDMERAAYLVLGKQIKKNRVKTCKVCGTVTTGREQTCAVGGKGKGRCGGEFSEEITPECNLQYIHDEIDESFINATVEKFNIAVEKIKTGEFPQCLTGCDKYFGRQCPYYKFCHENGNMDGLIKKESK